MVAQINRRYWSLRPLKGITRLMSYALYEGRPLGTRGRWINPVVFASLRAQSKLPLGARVDSPVFIIGIGRSGTTVLGTVLSMHRDIGFLNEPKALWHVVDANEDIAGNYSMGAARYRLGTADATLDLAIRARRLYANYLRATGARRVLDKYPELIFRVPYVRRIFPDAKFLFLTRNGIDTCRSIGNWSLGEGGSDEVQDWWGRDQRKWHLLVDQLLPEHNDLRPLADGLRSDVDLVDRAAVEWIVSMREGLRLRKEHPECVMSVLYESLVANPVETLDGIRRFCNLRPDPKLDAYANAELRPAAHHSSPRPLSLWKPLIAAFNATMAECGYPLAEICARDDIEDSRPARQ